ncbi:TetR/AcrR family transcriptional regulator [Gynurincola endophyticus]|jgi:AcrR family transcriptional regulator|uniref:TetR/AcrR family transcriptional regulator n=1 Tax=Gynurincola endophyticus TaxID=2479004 RepID=UPI000F8E1A71|nr:TetR/AcrR family transcriptional regulator [Gynurincola endophyticus]
MEILILKTAHYLFTSEGIVNYRMSDLASKLGISKKTIYKYYPTKEFLVERVVEIMIEEHEARLESSVDVYKGDTIREVIGLVHVLFYLGKDVNPAFYHDLQAHFPTQWKIFNDSLDRSSYQRMRQLLEKGITEGLVRGNLHPAMLMDLWKKHLVNDFEYASELINDYSKDEVYWQCLNLFIQGIISKEANDQTNEILHDLFESKHSNSQLINI